MAGQFRLLSLGAEAPEERESVAAGTIDSKLAAARDRLAALEAALESN